MFKTTKFKNLKISCSIDIVYAWLIRMPIVVLLIVATLFIYYLAK